MGVILDAEHDHLVKLGKTLNDQSLAATSILMVYF